jgi:hypothetical protein
MKWQAWRVDGFVADHVSCSTLLYRKRAKRAGNMRKPVMAIVGNSPHLGGAMSIADFTAWAGIGRTTAWKETKGGRSQAIKVSARTVITFADASRWLENCPDARLSGSSQAYAIHSRPVRLISHGK